MSVAAITLFLSSLSSPSPIVRSDFQVREDSALAQQLQEEECE